MQRKRPCKPADVVVPKNVLVRTLTKKDSTKQHKETKPLSWFSDNCPELFKCVAKELHPLIQKGHKLIIFHAEVKTGKRFAVEIYASYTTPVDPSSVKPGERIVHVFISSWIRRADDNQRRELNTYLRGTSHDQRVFKINTKKNSVRCINKLNELGKHYDRIIVHLDELDYGSGSDQHMASIYQYCTSQDKISLICYSASPEEALLKQLNVNPNTIPVKVVYTPPANYRGALWYCQKNLVREAEPFFTTDENDTVVLSNSAKELIQRAKERILSNDPRQNKRKLVIVRQNTDFGKIHDLIKDKKFPELKTNMEEDPTTRIRILPHFVHSNQEYQSLSVKWDDYSWWQEQLEEERGGNFLMIVFIDQSSSRSTDWFNHPWLSAYHDYHPPETPINTCLQSNLRVVYYINKFCDGKQVYNNEEFFPELHGQKDVIEYAAGLRELKDVARRVSGRAKVFEQLPTFGPVITTRLTEEEYTTHSAILRAPLTPQSRQTLDTLIRSKLSRADKATLAGRTLKTKRRYLRNTTDDEDEGTPNPQGGIYYVASNVVRKLNSRPGGGCVNEDYINRGNFFWIDVAMDELTFECENQTVTIPKGTVYITHGVADPEVDDDDETESVETGSTEYEHRTKNKSMYAM
jgi:hypothetical protein